MTDRIPGGDGVGAHWRAVLGCLSILTSAACASSGGETVHRAPLKGYPDPPSQAAPAEPVAAPVADPAPRPAAVPAPVAAPAPAPVVSRPMHSTSDAAMGLDSERSTSVEWQQGDEGGGRETRLRFAVHDVAADDVLNVRSGPSPRHPVVGTIPPDAIGIRSAGPRRYIGQSVWREIDYRGVRGWVNERFLIEERDLDRSR